MDISSMTCINLERRPDRLKEFKKNFEKTGEDFSIVTIFKAIDGQKIDSYILDNFEQKLKSMYLESKRVGMGEFGCWLSHYRVLKGIVDSNCTEDSLHIIFEDDAHFSDPKNFFKVLNNTFALKPKVDIVYPGGTFEPGWNGSGEEFKKVSDNLYLYDGYVSCRTLHFYIVSGGGAKKILKQYLSIKKFDAVDSHICNMKDLTRHDILPHLTYSPRDYKTDIQRPTLVDRFWLYPVFGLLILFVLFWSSPKYRIFFLSIIVCFSSLYILKKISKEKYTIYNIAKNKQYGNKVFLTDWEDSRLCNYIIQLINSIGFAQKTRSVIEIEKHSKFGKFLPIDFRSENDKQSGNTIKDQFFVDNFGINLTDHERRDICKQYILPKMNFKPDDTVTPDMLVIHIRSGDIFVVPHPNYVQPPFSFYKYIIDKYGYKKVRIISEKDLSNPSIKKIVDEYSDPKKGVNVSIQSKTLDDDVNSILSAKNLVVGVGSFGHILSLLSPSIKVLYCCDIHNLYYPGAEYEIVSLVIKNYMKLGEWTLSDKQLKLITDHSIEDIEEYDTSTYVFRPKKVWDEL